MTSARATVPTLTQAQADCLTALRNLGFSQGRIAVAAKLNLEAAEAALLKLQELGFVRQTDPGLWLATASGETSGFKTAPDPVVAARRESGRAVRAERRPPPPRLPVRSDRVRLVLQTIADEGALRIKGVRLLTDIPQRSINALMQYLKRKRLVAKAGDEFDAPYRLTEQGRATLAEMSMRRAA